MSPSRIARSGDRFDRALLRAARNDEPPQGAEDRALAALGLPAGLAARCVPRPGTFSAGRWGGGLKVVVVALVLGAAVAGFWMRAPRHPALAAVVGSGRSPDVGSPPSPSAAVAPPPLPASDEAPSARALGAPLAPGAPRKIARKVASATSVDGPALSSEIALVQQAARALAGGEAAIALDLLDTYVRDFPHGTLAEEAGALRVRALVQSGRGAAAKALAQKLVDTHPRGVLAPQLQSVIAGAPGGEAR